MVLVQPEQGVAQQKTPHFVAAIVEDVTVPIGMKSLPRIGVFVQMRAVKIRQTVFVVVGSGRAPNPK